MATVRADLTGSKNTCSTTSASIQEAQSPLDPEMDLFPRLMHGPANEGWEPSAIVHLAASRFRRRAVKTARARSSDPMAGATAIQDQDGK